MGGPKDREAKEFWARLDEDTREFLRALADPETGCGPLEFERAWTTQEEERQ